MQIPKCPDTQIPPKPTPLPAARRCLSAHPETTQGKYEKSNASKALPKDTKSNTRNKFLDVGCGFPSNAAVMVVEVNIFRAESVGAYKLIVSGRTLVLRISRQHALDAHADALDVLYRAPSLLAKEVEADDAVRVDVRVDRDRAVGESHKDHFGGF